MVEHKAQRHGISTAKIEKRPTKVHKFSMFSLKRELTPKEKITAQQGMFPVNQLPAIPRVSSECEEYINQIKKSTYPNVDYIIMKSSKKQKTRTKRTKLNGFMAYRAFYSKNVPKEHQSELSHVLSKEWKKDLDSQLIWKRYATEFNSLPFDKHEDFKFVTWLSKSFTSDITPKRSSDSENRIEDVFQQRTTKENETLSYQAS